LVVGVQPGKRHVAKRVGGGEKRENLKRGRTAARRRKTTIATRRLKYELRGKKKNRTVT